jgi:hypothetical protein
MAGGVIPGQNAFDALKIMDISGRRLEKGDMITPEAIITAESNAFLYYFNQLAPVITTALSIVSTLLATINLLSR